MKRLDFIITGTGRCGTGFAAKLLESAGVNCGHERFYSVNGYDEARARLERWPETRADSSWLAAPFLDMPPLDEAMVVHLVRHPRDVIASLLKIGFFNCDPRYYGHGSWRNFALNNLPEVQYHEQEIDRAARWYIGWNCLIEDKLRGREYVLHRIEDDPRSLLKALRINYEGCDLFDDTSYNSKTDATPPVVDLAMIDDGLAQHLNVYGYEWGRK